MVRLFYLYLWGGLVLAIDSKGIFSPEVNLSESEKKENNGEESVIA